MQGTIHSGLHTATIGVDAAAGVKASTGVGTTSTVTAWRIRVLVSFGTAGLGRSDFITKESASSLVQPHLWRHLLRVKVINYYPLRPRVMHGTIQSSGQAGIKAAGERD